MACLEKCYEKGGKVFFAAVIILAGAVSAFAEEGVTLKYKELKAKLDLATMSVDVEHRGVKWRMSRQGSHEFVYEKDGEIHEVSLADSQEKQVRQFGDSAAEVRFEDFRLEMLISIDEETGELVFKFTPLEEDHNFTIKGLIYPRPFEVPVKSDCYSFFPYGQGILIPGNWPYKEELRDPIQFSDEKRLKVFGEVMGRPANWWDFQGGDQAGLISHARMSCFGAVQPGSGFVGIIDTNCQMDTHLHVRHTPGKPTDYWIYWRPTMGEFGYPRIIRYHFEKDGDYVSLAKYHRQYFKKLGYLKSLAEKNEENPNVERLKGAISLRTRISRKDNRNFTYEIYNTFSDVGKLVEDFKEKTGVERAILSFTGWQRYGHDQEYPNIMPPMMAAGGPKGLGDLADKLRGMGYMFGLATDNYCDITLDSPSFREEVTLKDSQGKYFRRSTWAAGVNSLICPRWSLRFLRRNFEVGRVDYPPVYGLLDTAYPDYYLLGNYVCNWECYDPRHPLTRNENRQAISDIYQYFKDKKILLTTEHHIDWAIPYLVSVRVRVGHNMEYGVDKEGRTIGIPIPLWQLAFHDCTYILGSWGGTPERLLYPFLWGAQSAFSLTDANSVSNTEQIERAKLLAKLHEAVGWDEMASHKFYSDDYTVQESTFSSGVKVWIDPNKSQLKITGVDGISEEVRQLD